MTYRWGGIDPSNPEVFNALSEDERIAVTLEGTLVIMFVTLQDVEKVRKSKGIVCEMATVENKTYSHAVNFRLQDLGRGNYLVLTHTHNIVKCHRTFVFRKI